jgi:hypothetical protein
MSALERGRVLSAIGRKVLDNVELLAALEVHDVGKPLKQARADAVALARYFEFYGGCCDKVHGETLPFAAGYTALTLREPHGVTGHIVPWNYPMQIVGRSVGAALAMGNACVLKPAEEACLTVLAFARIALEAGLPPGALNVVPGLGEEAGAALSAHPGIDHLSFTGSVATGARVQTAAAANAVPVTLELGGKSPQVVFADADLDAALPFLVNAGIQNAGQTCSAASRILVERSLFEAVRSKMAERYRALRVGPAALDLDVPPEREARTQDRLGDGVCNSPGALRLICPPYCRWYQTETSRWVGMTEADFQSRCFRCDQIAEVDWPVVAICLAATDPSQRHIGIAYDSADGRRILHLEWHHRLVDQPTAAASFSLSDLFSASAEPSATVFSALSISVALKELVSCAAEVAISTKHRLRAAKVPTREIKAANAGAWHCDFAFTNGSRCVRSFIISSPLQYGSRAS